MQIQHHRQRGVAGEILQRGRQPVVQAAGAQPVGDLAQLADGGADLGDRLVEDLVEVERAVTKVTLGEPQRHAERHQPLLGAVVEVELEATPFLIPCAHESTAAGLDLLEGLADLEAKPAHLHEQRSSLGDVVDEPAGRADTRNDHPDPMARHHRRSGSRTGRDLPAVPVHAGLLAGYGVPDPERRVTQSCAEHRLELLGNRRPGIDLALQRSHRPDRPRAVRIEPRTDAARQPRAHRPEGEGDHRRADHGQGGRSAPRDEADDRRHGGEHGEQPGADDGVHGGGHDRAVHVVQIVSGHRDGDGNGYGDEHREQHHHEDDLGHARVPQEEIREPAQQKGQGHGGAHQLQPTNLVTLHGVSAAEPAEDRDHACCQEDQESRQHRHRDELQHGRVRMVEVLPRLLVAVWGEGRAQLEQHEDDSQPDRDHPPPGTG